MPTLESFAARFARCLRLFRDPGAKGEQKAEFRAVLGLFQETALTLRVHGGRLEVNGEPCEGEGLTVLIERLELHGIGEIAIPQDPPPAQLFELFRLLADAPGIEQPQSRLGGAGSTLIRIVASAAIAPPGAPPPSPSAPPAAAAETFGAGAPVIPDEQSGDRRSGALGTEGILRGESWRDIQSVPLQGVPLVTHDPAPPPAANALPGAPGAAAAPPPPQAASPPPRPPAAASAPEASEELSLSVEGTRGRTSGKRPSTPGASAPSPGAAAPVASGKPPSSAGAAPRATTPGPVSGVAFPPEVAAALTELAHHPEAPNIDDVLAGLVRQVESALTHNRMEQVLGIIGAIVAAERKVPDASGVRRQYTIALKRVYTKRVLDGLTQLVAVPKHRPEAVAALQRAGADAVEVLVDRLVSAPTVGERRGVFDALRQMTEGTEQLIQMLDHREWFVVRNVAELLGELGMDDAIPALARKLGHDDERVRKAVGLALAKIGTRSAAEPLRRALRDKSADVRMQVALGIGGRKSLALAMPIVVALEEEEDDTVVRELILALGRIGSPDAVQALIKVAQPAGRIFGRKPSGLRLAAVEALRLAGTPPAVGTLEGLADDGDRQVRTAAREALEQLKRKPRG
ncbi:MAG TPA: HEAT repeat domain-containing protein [Gemmatimonadales bacterium]|jgi:hypothetical protein|nr:HEAT repeat domain-containing protein [Gemmatimonadales bacterium]